MPQPHPSLNPVLLERLIRGLRAFTHGLGSGPAQAVMGQGILLARHLVGELDGHIVVHISGPRVRRSILPIVGLCGGTSST
jgi:hypothetical protein